MTNPGRHLWLIEIHDLDAEDLARVEKAIRVIEGVKSASALRDGKPYVVVECPTQSDSMRVQQTVATVAPAAIVFYTREGAGETDQAAV